MIAAAHPDAVRVVFHGVAHAMQPPLAEHRFEKMGALFEALKAEGVTEVVLAGAMARPPLDPSQFDQDDDAACPRA